MASHGLSSLDLDFDRLSLSSPHHQLYQQQQQAQSQQQGYGGRSPLLPPPSASSPAAGGAGAGQGAQAQLQYAQQKLEHPRRRGIVKFFNSLKGFGFVVDNEPGALGGQEVFCHFSAISGKGGFRSLAEGEEVEYELVQGPKGFQAANLTGPGGRTVVGDPKARLAKPPPYMPFAPMSLPLGSYMGDPYQQQHAGVYAASPYTQHVLYVPSTVALPSSQYASYAAPPPQQQQRSISATHEGRSPFAANAPSAANGYPGFAPPGPLIGGGPYAGLTGPAGVPPQGYGGYSSIPPQQQQQQQQRGVSANASFGNGAGGGGGGYPSVTGSPPQPTSFGFAPFSPPTASNIPLFGGPSYLGGGSGNGPSFHSPPSNSPPMPTTSSLYTSSLPPHLTGGGAPARPSSTHGAHASTSSSSSSNPVGVSASGGGGGGALFGAGGSVGPIGSSAGSRAGTPSAAAVGARTGTPLGNGSLNGAGEWKSSSSASQGGGNAGGVLYASAGGTGTEFA